MNTNLIMTLIGLMSLACSLSGQNPDGKAGKSDCIISLEGVDRHFIVYQPDSAISDPMPVVFMFHGTSGNGEKFYNISGWKEMADKEGLISVFPSALRYCIEENSVQKNTTKWNDGKLDKYACQGQILRNDVLFFREMVKFLKKNYPVDEKRIYASGFSNGANFVSRLTLEAPDILAATAMMAGFLQDTSYKATAFISSYLAIGDLNVQESGGKRPSWDESGIDVPQLRDRVMVMVDELQLERTYSFQDGDSIITWQFDNNKGSASNMFRFSLIKDLEHRYPNGKNYPIIIAELFWDYFMKFQK